MKLKMKLKIKLKHIPNLILSVSIAAACAGCSQIGAVLQSDNSYMQYTAEPETQLSAPQQNISQSEETPDERLSARDFSETITVNSSEEFFALLREARDELVPEMHLKITDYSDEYYDINNFEKGKYTLISKGKRWGSLAHMDYTFVYSESYALTRAIEEPRLLSRLTDEQKSIIERLKALLPQIVREDMSDYQKELAIHDYLAANFEYDTAAVVNGEVSENSTRISVFLDTHKGVCEAYAYTFKALCDLSGIECHIATGKLDGEGHAWNIVKLNGSYYHVDVTADDPIPDEAGHAYHNYFNITDARIQKTHILDEARYECNNTQYDYFTVNNLNVNGSSAFVTLVERELAAGKTTVVFRTQNYYVNEDDINTALSWKGFSSYVVSGDMNDPDGEFELRLYR